MKQKLYLAPEIQVVILAEERALCDSYLSGNTSTPGGYEYDDQYQEME